MARKYGMLMWRGYFKKAEWGTVPQRRGKYPTKATLSRLWNPHERACTSWRAEACLRGFSIHTPDPVVGQYATQLTVEPPWRCVRLMTGWSMSTNFIYINLKGRILYNSNVWTYEHLDNQSLPRLYIKCMNIWTNESNDLTKALVGTRTGNLSLRVHYVSYIYDAHVFNKGW